MLNNNGSASITIDGVVIEKGKNLYDVVGAKKKASDKDITEKIQRKLGEILVAKHDEITATNYYDASGSAEITKLRTASVILSNPQIKSAYDLARANNEADIAISVGTESVDCSEDYYALLGVKQKVKADDVYDAMHSKVGELYMSSENDQTPTVLQNHAQFKSLENAYKILANPINRAAYDEWLKRNKIKVKGVDNSSKARKAASDGIAFVKKWGLRTLIALAIAGVLAGGTYGIMKLVEHFSSDDPDLTDEFAVSDTAEPEQEATEQVEFGDPNDAEQTLKRANKIFNEISASGLPLTIYDPATTGTRDLTVADIESLVYWTNYPYLTNDNLDKACDIDTAALLISQLVANYGMTGQTSSRIAGITLDADPNAGTYSFDFGQFFIDNSEQQELVSGISSQLNEIKNNPTMESQGVAVDIYRDAVEYFSFGNAKLPLEHSEYNQANFMYGQILLGSLAPMMANLEPSFEMDGALFNDFQTVVKHLQEVDGPINMIGRSIQSDMAVGMSLGFDPCE